MINKAQAHAIAARFPTTVKAGDSTIGVLHDLDNGEMYVASNVREALGWIAAGAWDSDGTNPRTTRLANWWHKRCSVKESAA